MLRICTECCLEKEIDKFVRQGKLYRYKCKECRNSKQRTGKIHLGRFKKGFTPWNKGVRGLQKAWNKGVPVSEDQKKKISVSKIGSKSWNKEKVPKSRQGHFRKKWAINVKDRDKWECQKCGIKENLDAHHIVPWMKDESKRFDVNNGITLCSSCHGKEEGFQKGIKSWNSGKKMTEEHKQKLRKPKTKRK